MSNYQGLTVLLDPGHGGMINGKYSSCPNWKEDNPKTWYKMYVHNGVPFYEGVWNRIIVDMLKGELSCEGIRFFDVVASQEDVPLGERVRRANFYSSKYPNCLYLSIHSNAGGGKGFEVYTSVGDTPADPLAEIIFQEIKKEFPKLTMRTDTLDGDSDKEAHFFVLNNTSCPAVLPENLFFDNPTEVKLLQMKSFQERLVKAYMEALKRINKQINDAN